MVGRLPVSRARPLNFGPAPRNYGSLGDALLFAGLVGVDPELAGVVGDGGGPLGQVLPARGYIVRAASLPCGALRWRGRSHPLPLQPPLPLLLLLSHAEHMVRDPRLLKSQRSSPSTAAWLFPSVFL